MKNILIRVLGMLIVVASTIWALALATITIALTVFVDNFTPVEVNRFNNISSNLIFFGIIAFFITLAVYEAQRSR